MPTPIEQDEKDKYKPLFIIEIFFKNGLLRIATRDLEVVSS